MQRWNCTVLSLRLRISVKWASCLADVYCSVQVYSLIQQLMKDLPDLPAAKSTKVISFAVKRTDQMLTRLHCVGHLLNPMHQKENHYADEVSIAHTVL